MTLFFVIATLLVIGGVVLLCADDIGLVRPWVYAIIIGVGIGIYSGCGAHIYYENKLIAQHNYVQNYPELIESYNEKLKKEQINTFNHPWLHWNDNIILNLEEVEQ